MSMGGGGRNGGRTRGGPGGRPRARSRVAVMAVLALALVAVLVLFLALTGGSGDPDPGKGSDFNPAVSGGEVTGSASRAQDEDEDELGSGNNSGLSSEDGPGDDEGSGDRASESDGSESRPVSGEPEEPEQLSHRHEDEEYVDLTESQRDRLRLAATDFILAAYGYPEDDWARYSEEIRPEVDWGVFYESPAGQEINQRIERMREGKDSRLSGAVIVERFETGEVEGSGESEKVNAVAYFEAAESFSPDGEAEGRAADYRQSMTLVTDDETYLVRSAEVPEEVR